MLLNQCRFRGSGGLARVSSASLLSLGVTVPDNPEKLIRILLAGDAAVSTLVVGFSGFGGCRHSVTAHAGCR